MKRIKNSIVLITGILILIVGVISLDVIAEQARALTWKYDNVTTQCKTIPGYGGSKLDDLDAQSFGDSWLDEMTDRTRYSTRTLDTTVYGSEVTDRNSAWWGNDHVYSNLDDGDATMWITHGGTYASLYGWYGVLSTSSGNGDPNPDHACSGRSAYMNVGGDDAEYLFILACESARWEVIYNGTDGYYALHQRLHMFGGLHGAGNTGNWDNVANFAAESNQVNAAMSFSWVENFTDLNHWPNAPVGQRDLCAVSITQGDNNVDAYNRMLTEDFTNDPLDENDWPDPNGNGLYYLYYANCDPPGGANPLPWPPQ